MNNATHVQKKNSSMNKKQNTRHTEAQQPSLSRMERNTRQNNQMQSNNKRKRQHRQPEPKKERTPGGGNKKNNTRSSTQIRIKNRRNTN